MRRRRPKPPTLKPGDHILITGVPFGEPPGYHMDPETVRVYRKLVARWRPVRINRIDEFGIPWYDVRFKRPGGQWEHHTLAVFHEDTNWIPYGKR